MDYMMRLIVQKLIAITNMPIVIIIQLTTRHMVIFQWLLHLLNIPQQPTEIKEQDVYTLTRRLLFKIDQEHFEQMNDELRYGCNHDQEFLEIFTHIASYLTTKDFKKLNCQYQKEVLNKRDTSQLLGLVMYVAVNSDMKKDSIQTILQFEEDQQLVIMKTIQNIESKCEQVTQLKKVVEKIESIEQQNQILREKSMIKQEAYQHKITQIQQIQSWNTIFSKQNEKYEQQKLAILKELNITEIQQFTEICLASKQQNDDLASNLQLLLGDKETLAKQNTKLKKELKHCGETIQRQIMSIQQLKSKCKQMNQQYWLVEYISNRQSIDIPTLPLRDNQNILNLDGIGDHQKTKILTQRTECSNCVEEVEESFQNRNNLHVLLTLRDLERSYEQKLRLIEQLKQEKKVQLNLQRKLDKKIKKIKECHHFFFNLYQNKSIIKV